MIASINTNKEIDYVNQIKKKRTPLAMRFIGWYIKGLSIFSSSKAADFAVKLFQTPRNKPLADEQVEWYDKGQSEFITIDNQEIFVWTSGENPSVLIVHGWGSSSYQLHYLIDFLVDKGVNVMTFDYPAHGQSSGKRATLMEVEATIIQLLNKFQTIDSVIGYSFGGLALHRPVQQILQINNFVTMGSPKRLDSITGTFFAMFDIPEKVRRDFYYKMENIVDVPKEEWVSNTHKRFSEVDILQIHDQNDNVVPLKDAEKFKELNPSIEYVITQGYGHRGLLKSIEVFDHIHSFLQS